MDVGRAGTAKLLGFVLPSSEAPFALGHVVRIRGLKVCGEANVVGSGGP